MASAHRTLWIASVIGIAAIGCRDDSAGDPVAAPTATPRADSSQTARDRLAAYMAGEELRDFSGSIALIRDGKIVFEAGYGLANRELNVANTPVTKFRIGSITKQFTAMAILILQERGRLQVDDPIGEHLQGLPEAWRPITVHQLLTHTSGIMYSWALPDFEQTMMVPATAAETIARFYDEPLVFEPGAGFEYSGLNYVTLARVVEVASGISYEQFLRREIFEPLGMEDSGADRPEAVLANRAAGYVRSEQGLANAPVIYMPILTGAGNLYSTVRDLAAWDRGLAAGKLISAEAYDAMYRPVRNNYAYGWTVVEWEGATVLAHPGNVPGFAAFFLRAPEKRLSVIVLSNVRPTSVKVIACELAHVALGLDERKRLRCRQEPL